MAQIFRSPQAKIDQLEIWLYLARKNEEKADLTLRQLDEKVQALLRHPKLGRKREDLKPGLRCLIVGEYQVFYHLIHADIEIVRVFHSARNIKEEMFDES